MERRLPEVRKRRLNVTLADDLLPACTVRVDVGGRPLGTGFFVSPGLVATAAHVIESFASMAAPITAVDRSGAVHEVDVLKADEQGDVAVLKLRKVPQHDCVLLDSDLKARDQLHTYGFPEKYPDGVPTTLEAEGEMGGDAGWVKFKAGVIQPGMSGSPLLNLTSGGVCGILKRSRDAQADLGGYAIPVTTLLKLMPDLRQMNIRVHMGSDRWLLSLSPDRQALIKAGWQRGSEVDPEPTFFVVTVSPDEANVWSVLAKIHPSGESIGPEFTDLNQLRPQVARLFRNWATRRRVLEKELVNLLGSVLFGAVFSGDVRKRFEELLAQREGARLKLCLRFESNTQRELVELPWEHLYVPPAPAGVPLAIDPFISFSRTSLAEPSMQASPPPDRPISVLVIAAKPNVFAQATQEQVMQVGTVQQVVDGLAKTSSEVERLEVTSAQRIDPVGLEDEVTGHDVIHYVGFGRFDGGMDKLALGADTANGIDYLTVDDLVGSLQKVSPKLVVLQLFEGTETDIPADFSMMAPPLLQRAPAVVAFQYPLSASSAVTFNETMYKQLAQGTPVDRAVQEARRSLRLQARASVAAALFLREPTELRLSAPPGEAVPSQPNYASSSV